MNETPEMGIENKTDNEKKQRLRIIRQKKDSELNEQEQKMNKTKRFHGTLYLVAAIAFLIGYIGIKIAKSFLPPGIDLVFEALLGLLTKQEIMALNAITTIRKLGKIILTSIGIGLGLTDMAWVQQLFEKMNLQKEADIAAIEEQLEKMPKKKEERLKIIKQIRNAELSNLKEGSKKDTIKFALYYLGAAVSAVAATAAPVVGYPALCFFMAKGWKNLTSWIDKKQHQKSLETQLNEKEAELRADEATNENTLDDSEVIQLTPQQEPQVTPEQQEQQKTPETPEQPEQPEQQEQQKTPETPEQRHQVIDITKTDENENANPYTR